MLTDLRGEIGCGFAYLVTLILWSWAIYRPIHNSRDGTTKKFS